MPHYGERNELEKLRRRHLCAECGAELCVFVDYPEMKPYLACADYQRTHHEGIAERLSEYQKKGIEALNLETRREIMVSTHGEEKTNKLIQYIGATALTKVQAREIINTIWPGAEKASPAEVYKAIAICEQYHLNPLMGHIFLVPFDKKDNTGNVIGTSFIAIRGIGSDRLIASRKHAWTFLDFSPRIMTGDEEKKVYGEKDPNKLRVVSIMRDIKTGAEVYGYGEWAKTKSYKDKIYANEPKGTDKGNSIFNMAAIRAERNGLAKLYPADMPSGDMPVEDEHFIQSESGAVNTNTGEIIDGEATEITSEDQSPTIESLERIKRATEEVIAQKEAKKETKSKRDPATIKSLGDLYSACREDFPEHFKFKLDVLTALGKTETEIVDPAVEYCKITVIVAAKAK